MDALTAVGVFRHIMKLIVSAPTVVRKWTEVTTMRLIDADKLERQEFDGEEACFDYVDAEDIDNAPTVDAVEVVRCKDCYQSVVIGNVLHCTYWSKDTDENGYCHEGG